MFSLSKNLLTHTRSRMSKRNKNARLLNEYVPNIYKYHTIVSQDAYFKLGVKNNSYRGPRNSHRQCHYHNYLLMDRPHRDLGGDMWNHRDNVRDFKRTDWF